MKLRTNDGVVVADLVGTTVVKRVKEDVSKKITRVWTYF